MNGNEQNKNKGNLSAYSLAGIGIGGVIGAGFFLGSSLAISEAGPSVVAAFLLGGLVMSQVLGAMTSISMNGTSRKSFREYADQMLGRYIGTLLGWVVSISGILTLSSEALASGIFIKYWLPHIPVAFFALFALLLAAGINATGLKDFGYVETGMAVIKILTILTFVALCAIFIFSKGIPVAPSPFSSFSSFFPKGVPGFLQSMLIVLFSYAGVSAVAMAVSDVRNPRRDIPKATVITALGVTVLYVISMAVIVSLVKWDSVNTGVSPFVQAFGAIGIMSASTIMNAIILIAALSVMIATFFSCSKMLVSLSESREAPSILKKATPRDFHKNAWVFVAGGAFLAIVSSFILGEKLFNYLVSASSYFSFLNWTVNLITYLVWMKKKDEDKKYHSPLIWGRAGAYATLAVIALFFVLSLRVADFRMGFFVALTIYIVITTVYVIHRRRKGKNGHALDDAE